MPSVFSQVRLIDFEDKEYVELEGKVPNGVYLAGEEYRHFDGKPWIFPSVKLAEEQLRKDAPVVASYFFSHMYDFPVSATKIVLGENSPAIKENRVSSAQTPSGTAALRIGAEFLVSELGKTVYYYSNPTWDTLHILFENAQFKEARPYRYWCPKIHDIDFLGLLEDLGMAPEGAVIVLQTSCHNPTGMDLKKEQWKDIANIMKERRLIPFFDCAFQGLGRDLDEDAWPVRYFVGQGFELLCAQSLTKNYGLYSERIGNIFVVSKSPELKELVQGSVNSLVRGMFLTIAAPAARIITKIWYSDELRKQWIKNLETIKNRLGAARKLLQEALESSGTRGEWNFITNQTGWKSMIGLNAMQVDFLAKKYQVYLSRNGSLNISAITKSNVEYVAKAITLTLISIPSECNTI